MRLRNLILAGLLVSGVGPATGKVLAQLPDSNTRIYTLLSGSRLTNDCLLCDRVPIVAPMTGTFRLRFVGQDPLYTHYQVQEISFHAGTNGGAEYWVSGSGTYQVGGELAVVQDLFLDVNINNGFSKTEALCANADRAVTQRWPRIEVSVLQTNGTEAEVYSLVLVAEPALQFLAITPDYRNRNVVLQWDSNGRQTQLERAAMVEGPYSPISPITTDQTFTDLGALTNQAAFYRLRQY